MSFLTHLCKPASRRILFNGRSQYFNTRLSQQDTIFALSTAQGKAGIAVIRVSGLKASDALISLAPKDLKKPLPTPRKATKRIIVHPTTGEMLDHGLVLWFPGPNSYTGQDVAEFHIHGGISVISGVLDALGSVEGFRHAEQGEFTRRAFDNDKLDLTEIEGLADLLNAETEAQRRQALRQAQGSLKNLYESWRKQLIENIALIEAVIDFSEDENIEDGVFEQAVANVKQVLNMMINHVNDNRRGEILRDGIHVTLFGPPNVGKSSFLNCLAQRQAVIVSSIPGTTRDIIEISLNIGGYPVIIGDTAGLRQSNDIIEIEGIKRAKDRILLADIKMCILSSFEVLKSLKSNDENSFRIINPLINESLDKSTFLILNKSDLLNESELAYLKKAIAKIFPENYICYVSCINGDGIKEFLDIFVSSLKHKYDNSATQVTLITQSRHRENLNDCIYGLQSFLAQKDIVLAAEELRYATNALGRITGSVEVDEVLNVIFERFCIGK
ncbi:tRNA modification GTPase TrmE [Gigaspora margarita]|uniref:tRNA modification GTPase TrmE n=1 Tax=Gigaspora margarita TaxID=4874 RepID=A0A8H4B3V3_GIGMA|nr:tRNA modification GTPase TrmE [Gigaspora margarita]